ncbi:MAG: GNAT family N-acetyltransferase, partial [Actinomycetota bacterium]
RAGDGAAIGRAHVRAWQHGYAHILPATFLDGLDAVQRGAEWEARIESGSTDGQPAAGQLPSITIVGALAGDVLGFASYGPYRSTDSTDRADDEGLCELWGLNVDPEAWGTGLAQALMAQTRAGLVETHGRSSTAVLWVLADNHRGRRFYQKENWRPDGVEQPLDLAGTEVTELRYATQLGD